MKNVEESYEQMIERQKKEIEKIKNEILKNLSSYSVATETSDFTTIEISSFNGCEGDSFTKIYAFEKKSDVIVITYLTHATLGTEQSYTDSVEKSIPTTEENLKLFSILCDEVITASQRPRCYYYSNNDSIVSSQAEGKKTVVSKFVTPKTLAILSIWFKLSDEFIIEVDEWNHYDAKMHEGYGVESGKDSVEDSGDYESEKDTTLYSFTYKKEDEEQTFSLIKEGFGMQYFETDIKKGENRHVKRICVYLETDEMYYNAFSEMKEWIYPVETTEDETAPFCFYVKGEKPVRTTKLNKRLLDLINFFAPEVLTIPEELLIDKHDSVYVRAGKTIPDEAYLNNKYVNYLRIFADETESIGERAFMGSSLKGVELCPKFYEYEGTGNMPDKIGKDAFADCADLDVYISGDEVYLRTPLLPSDVKGYSLKIATLSSKSDKKRYKNAYTDALRSDKIRGKNKKVNEDFIIENGVLTEYNGKGGAVIIPDGVTEISDEAFSGCYSLTSIEIPSSVKKIGKGAFSGCESLKEYKVSPENLEYKAIDGNLYSKDGKTLIMYAKGKKDKNYTIPDGVTEICEWAFAVCESLTSVTISEGVTKIGEWAFARCESLTSINIPGGVTEIDESVFLLCSNLTITAPKGSYAIEYAKEHGIEYKEI